MGVSETPTRDRVYKRLLAYRYHDTMLHQNYPAACATREGFMHCPQGKINRVEKVNEYMVYAIVFFDLLLTAGKLEFKWLFFSFSNTFA